MFEHLKEFDSIIVTGSHRSGTRITTMMIANDTGFEPIVEHKYGCWAESVGSDRNRWERLNKFLAMKRVVIQGPAIFHLVPQMTQPRRAIVMNRRDFDDIHASEQRMYVKVRNYRQAPLERQDAWERPKLLPWVDRRMLESTGVAELKAMIWKRWIMEGIIHHPVVNQYESLEAHPMWVPEKKRRRLGKKWHNVRTSL